MCAQRREVPELLYREELPELELLEQKTRTVLRKGKIYLASGSHCMFGSRVVICIVKSDESQAAKSGFWGFFDKALIGITNKTLNI